MYKPMVMLMQFYARNNSTGNALSIANEIITLPPKFNTERWKYIKKWHNSALIVSTNNPNSEMKKQSLYILSIILIITLSGFKYPAKVNQVLEKAGNNRTELEKVLEHYRKIR